MTSIPGYLKERFLDMFRDQAMLLGFHRPIPEAYVGQISDQEGRNCSHPPIGPKQSWKCFDLETFHVFVVEKIWRELQENGEELGQLMMPFNSNTL
jgi:hypothetical protein